MSVPGDGARLAVGTLTVLPVRPPRSVDRATAAWAMAVAPLAVLPVAVAAGALVWALAAADAPPLLTAVLALAVVALGSGGLHLDGLADTADGLAVPGDRDRRLAVMRTGDVGPVGAATLLLVLMVQASALAGVVGTEGGEHAAATAGLAVAASRVALALACLRGVPPTRTDGLGRAVAGSVPIPAALLALAVVAGAAGAVHGVQGLAGVVAVAATTTLVLLVAHRRLGGVTGDVLGCCVELALAGYLVAQVVSSGVG